jgi:hypothetical protein
VRTPWISRVASTVAFLLLVAGGFAVSQFMGGLAASDSVAPRAFAPQLLEAGPHLLMVYVGSSDCAWSTDASLPGAVGAIRERLLQHARDQGMHAKFVGVSIDWDVDAGFEHLRGVGQFDEVSIGSNWANSWVLRFNAAAPEQGVPAIYLLRQEMAYHDDDRDALLLKETSSELLAVRRGLQPILAWAESPGALP